MVGSAVGRPAGGPGSARPSWPNGPGTSQPSIARLEKGQVSPTVITLDRIARALGTDLVIDFEPQPGGKPGTRASSHARFVGLRARRGTSAHQPWHRLRRGSARPVESERMHYRCPDAQNRGRGAGRPHGPHGGVVQLVEPLRQEHHLHHQGPFEGKRRCPQGQDRRADPDRPPPRRPRKRAPRTTCSAPSRARRLRPSAVTRP